MSTFTERMRGPLRQAAVLRLVNPPGIDLVSVPAPVWRGQTVVHQVVDEPPQAVDQEPSAEFGRHVVANAVGLIIALFAGIAPGLVLDPALGLATGVAAGMLGGLGGRFAAGRFYDRFRDPMKEEKSLECKEKNADPIGIGHAAW